MHGSILLNVGVTGTILGEHSPGFSLENVSFIYSFPDFVMACSLPKFSLKCIAAINNLCRLNLIWLYIDNLYNHVPIMHS